MMMPASVFPSEPSQAVALMQRLWVHEASRVFCDRLVDDLDRNWFMDQVKGGKTDGVKGAAN